MPRLTLLPGSFATASAAPVAAPAASKMKGAAAAAAVVAGASSLLSNELVAKVRYVPPCTSGITGALAQHKHHIRKRSDANRSSR